MLALTLPRRIKKLVRNLQARGFALEMNEPKGFIFGSERIVLTSPTVNVWVVFDRGWELSVGGGGLDPQPVNLWKACLDKSEARVRTEGLEWECDFVESHLHAMEAALAPEEIAQTTNCMDLNRDECFSRLVAPYPLAPWSLDGQPRPGVQVHFGVRWKEDGFFVLPEITIDNQTDSPFYFQAGDFRLAQNGFSQQVQLARTATPPGKVSPWSTWKHKGTSLWSWESVLPLNTVELTYVSSDPRSESFTAKREWQV